MISCYGCIMRGMGPQSDDRQRLGAVGSFRVHKSYYAITRQITKCNRHNNSDREQLRRHADWKHNNSSDSNQPVNVEMSQTLFFFCHLFRELCSAACCIAAHLCSLPTWNLHISLSMWMISFFLTTEFYSLRRKRRILSSAGLESKLESGQREQRAKQRRAPNE